MGALVATLTEFSNSGDSFTYTTTGHTATRPKLVIMKRRVPEGNKTVAVLSVDVIHATEDSDGNIMPSKIVGGMSFRVPIGFLAADLANVKTLFKDLAQSTELDNAIDTLEPLA